MAVAGSAVQAMRLKKVDERHFVIMDSFGVHNSQLPKNVKEATLMLGGDEPPNGYIIAAQDAHRLRMSGYTIRSKQYGD